MAARPDLFGPEVQVAGYMLVFGTPSDQHGGVGRFLLVPDRGNWVHPPHLDPKYVIDVIMKDHRTTPFLERKAVIVGGTLSVDPMDLHPGHVIYHLTATAVQAFVK